MDERGADSDSQTDRADAEAERLGRGRYAIHAFNNLGSVGEYWSERNELRIQRASLEADGFVVDSIETEAEDCGIIIHAYVRYNGPTDEAVEKLEMGGFEAHVEAGAK